MRCLDVSSLYPTENVHLLVLCDPTEDAVGHSCEGPANSLYPELRHDRVMGEAVAAKKERRARDLVECLAECVR